MAASLTTEAAEAAHRALDTADNGWHYRCMDGSDDGSPRTCFKGDEARRMLENDVIPAVLAAVSDHLERVFEANALLLPVEVLRWVQAELRVEVTR